MIKIAFKNLEKSELAKDITLERLNDAIIRFPDLEKCKIRVTLAMENSPQQAGPDVFKVKFQCQSGKYDGVIIERSASTIYIALAELADNLLERLNRFGDKERVRKIKQARKVRKKMVSMDETTSADITPLKSPTP